MERRIFRVLLVLVISLGATLRLVDLGGPSLWLDEILHLQVAQSLADDPWYRHLAGVREIKGGTENGALYYRLQIWGQKLAPGETGVRLFPAIIGTLTLPLMAQTGQLLGGRLVALLATFLLAVSPLHVYFSREGRPYYLLMALALLLLYALLKKGSRKGVWIAYIGCPLATYTGLHAVPILLSFAALSGMGWISDARLWRVANARRWRDFKQSPYLHYLVAATLALGLAYGLYMTESKTNTPLQKKAPVQAKVEQSPLFPSPLSERSLKTFLASMTTSGHPTILTVKRSWILITLALTGLLATAFRQRRAIVATAGMFLLPAALSVAALVSVGRWYGMRYTSAALPAFLLLVALGIAASAEFLSKTVATRLPKAKQNGVKGVATAVMLLLFVAPNLSAARTDPYRKLDWRGVAHFFDALALEDEPVVIPNGWPEICLGYYLEELGRPVEFVSAWETVALAESLVAERQRGWLLTAGFRRTNEVRAWMHQFVPVLKKAEEEMDLFFFPDFETLLETRFAAHKGAVFEERFAALGQRFDFDGGESLLQGKGWSFPEENEVGTSFQWALSERVVLGLPIGRPRDTSLRLRALPFIYPEAPPQQVELWLNETHLATLNLPTQWSEHQIEIPASSWNSGANILALRFAHSAQPANVLEGSGDSRQLSAAFDYLEIVP